MRGIACLLLLGMADAASAQSTFTLQPPEARAGEAVALRIDNALGCFRADLINVTREGATVAVVAHIEDAAPPGPCPASWVTPRFVALGTFAAGDYVVQATTCTNAPPPLPECALQATLPLTVYGVSESTFTVPALSSTLAIGLALVLMTFGALLARRSD